MTFKQLKRRDAITLLVGAAAWPLAARAQGKTVRIGFVSFQSAALAGHVEYLREGLRQLGYVEPRRSKSSLISPTATGNAPATLSP